MSMCYAPAGAFTFGRTACDWTGKRRGDMDRSVARFGRRGGRMDDLVSTEWLEQELGAPDLRIVDATFLLSGDGRDARAEYEAAHIPGAVFLDIDEVSDTDSPFPHMLPSEAKMASR